MMNEALRTELGPATPAMVGRHRPLARIGVGGMATVYLARALGGAGFERFVALKALHPHLLMDDEFVRMFVDEARVAARIHHPNVVAIHDLDDGGGALSMVMDYVAGDTLAAAQRAALASAAALPLRVVLRVALDVLAGLHAAHELRDLSGRPLHVVHRDVSPQNILVGVDGVARVTDFGIARAEERLSFTGVGTVKGKAPYMAPEQRADGLIDRRVDVYAMGVTVWEALSLQRYNPALAQGPRRYRSLRGIIADAPPELDAILAKSMAPEAVRRFPTAQAFAESIERALREHVGSHREVAALMQRVAGAKVAREQQAMAPPRSAVVGLRGRSGVVSLPPPARCPRPRGTASASTSSRRRRSSRAPRRSAPSPPRG